MEVRRIQFHRKANTAAITFSVTIDQRDYIDTIPPIQLDRIRRGQPKEAITEHERDLLRSLIGKLSWPARESMPEINFNVSFLQQVVGKIETDDHGRPKRYAMVQHLQYANATLKKAKRLAQQGEPFTFTACDPRDLCLVTFTDASWANMPGYGSQSGMRTIVTQKKIMSEWAKASTIEWSSSRIKRVVKSTLAAEAASLPVGQDKNEFARVALAYMFGLANVGEKIAWQELLKIVPGYLVVDCKSLYDYIHASSGLPSEKRVALDLVAVKEAVEIQGDKIFWIPTAWMLADPLTKDIKDHLASEILTRRKGYSLKQEVLVQAANRLRGYSSREDRAPLPRERKKGIACNHASRTLTRSEFRPERKRISVKSEGSA